MFNKDSNLKNINIISKFISLFFVFLSIFITNNVYVFMLFSLVFLYYDKFNIFTVTLIALSIINYFYDMGIVLKLLFIVVYIKMFIKIIDFNQIRYLLESLFYKRNSKTLFWFLYICYFYRSFKNSIKELFDLIKSYGFKLNFNTIKFTVKESINKSKVYVERIMLVYKYRLYNISNNKSYVDKDKLDSYDFKYILIYVLIFLLIYVLENSI